MTRSTASVDRIRWLTTLVASAELEPPELEHRHRRAQRRVRTVELELHVRGFEPGGGPQPVELEPQLLVDPFRPNYGLG